MFKRIVKFSDGTYGVRKWCFLGYKMLDIYDCDYWWYGNGYWSVYCKGTLEEAKNALEKWNNRNK